MKNVLTPLAKSVLVPLGLTAAAPAAIATDAAIQKKSFRSRMKTLIISNQEMDEIIKTVKSLKESGFLKKRLIETIEAKQQKSGIYQYVIKYTI